MDIGFIGLGNMGAHMARRLVEAGHKVVVYDTRQEAIGNLAALGAIAVRSPAEVADAAETVMASLPTPDVVLNVATGPRGVIEGKRVRRFVDLSTTGAVMAQRIFELLRGAQHRADRQPGERRRARRGKGTLAVMVSGPRADVAAVEPALKVIGKIFVLGERPGLGQTMKLVNNVLSAAAMAATAEAMVTGVKAGLDPRQMLEVINAGTGRNTATEDKFAKAVLPGTFDLGFAAGADAQRRQAFSRRTRSARRADRCDRSGRAAFPAHMRRMRSRSRPFGCRSAGRKACRREGAGFVST